MTARHPSHDAQSGAQPLRDPTEWKTGDEPITASQRSYLETLATEAGEQIDNIDQLTKAEAALQIEELQRKTGRGQPKTPDDSH
jgi:hypothetical protein